MLGMIMRSFIYKNVDIILPLYNSLVCSRLEYCVQAWSLYLRKDIELLEKVQKRATRIIDGFADKDYNDRLKELGITTLETRCKRGDLIEVFKIIKGFENVNRELFFQLAINTAHLRGHGLIFFKEC